MPASKNAGVISELSKLWLIRQVQQANDFCCTLQALRSKQKLNLAGLYDQQLFFYKSNINPGTRCFRVMEEVNGTWGLSTTNSATALRFRDAATNVTGFVK